MIHEGKEYELLCNFYHNGNDVDIYIDDTHAKLLAFVDKVPLDISPDVEKYIKNVVDEEDGFGGAALKWLDYRCQLVSQCVTAWYGARVELGDDDLVGHAQPEWEPILEFDKEGIEIDVYLFPVPKDEIKYIAKIRHYALGEEEYKWPNEKSITELLSEFRMMDDDEPF